MFTWICPKCGREVPPSASECPNCAQPDRDQPATPTVPPASPPQPVVRRAGRMPGWILALLFATGFLALGFAGYFAYMRLSARDAPTARSTPPAEQAQVAVADILTEYIEVTGFRLVEDTPKRIRVRFVIVNHSQAPLVDLAGVVTLRPTTAKPGAADAVGTFAFRLSELGPLEIRDMTAPLESKLRVYELPDWEFLRADLKLTTTQKKP